MVSGMPTEGHPAYEPAYDDAVRGRLTEILRTRVALADDVFDAVVWAGVDYLTDEISDQGGEPDPATVSRTVWDLADSLFAEHLAAQANWPEHTDNDRLSAAFQELGRDDVAAREAFTCCQNCGHSEILDGYRHDQLPRGYVFYHQQDAERGVEGQGIYLADGAPGDKAAFAGEIVETLRRQGLQPKWDGSTGTRIFVPLTWQRRRVGRLAAHPGGMADPDFTVAAEPIDWDGPPVMAGGESSAHAWAALRLPWLPTGASLRLSAGDRSMVVRREWDQLVNEHGIRVARHDAWSLVSTLVPEPVPSLLSEPELEPPMLEVQYAQHGARSNRSQLPMTLDECRWLLRSAPAAPGGNTIYTSRSGKMVQHIWNAEGTLWLEHLDQAAKVSHGRLVTPDEVDQVITVLAREDRVILGDLGPLETVAW